MTDDETLVQYLRSILGGEKIASLERDLLGEDRLALCDELRFLGKRVEEYRAFAKALSDGNLTKNEYSPENTLCHPLKHLHANLLTLTTQAQRVAAGDYSQVVSFMDDFSDAFNSMTWQLREHESQFRQMMEGIAREKETMFQSNALFVALTEHVSELIVVNDAHTGVVLYINKPEVLDASNGAYAVLLEGIEQYVKGEQHPDRWTFKYEADHLYYNIITLAMEWNGRSTYASVVQDVTAERLRALELEDNFNRDPATNLYNRRHCMSCLEHYIEEQVPFSLCFIDLDNLKLVNDTYGHVEGDRYIAEVARGITQQIRITDVCARVGGDEFVVLFRQCSCTVAQKKMRQAAKCIRDAFEDDDQVRRSISFGVVEVDYTQPVNPNSLLAQADKLMYKQKRRNKAIRPQDNHL